MSDQLNEINPQVKTTTIGVRVLREIKVYPLSVMEQLELSDIVSKAIVDFFKMKEETVTKVNVENIEFVNLIIDLLKNNIMRIIDIATDENPEKVLRDMTNPQLVDFIELIYQDNFGKLRKKVMGLVQMVLPKGVEQEM